MSPEEAIHQACLLRFRPIMMTTMAALLGALPLALGTGTGSELRRPLGISIVGGLLISQVLTLYTTPVIYLYMTRLAASVRAASVRRGEAAPSHGSAVNISEPFIRRPDRDVAARRGDPSGRHLGVHAPAGRAAAARRLPDDPGAARRCPARARRRWRRRSRRRSSAASGASRASPRSRRRARSARRPSRSSSISIATSTPPRATCRPRSPPRAASCRTNLPLRPTYRKVNPADSPILILSLTSDTLPLAQVFDAANTILAQKISQVPGVGQVTVGGGQQPAVRVQVDPARARGLGPRASRTCATRSRRRPSDQPKGIVRRARRSRVVVGANDQLFGADRLSRRSSSRTRTAPRSASATSPTSSTTSRTTASRRGRTATRAVLVIIRRQPGANIIETNERIRKRCCPSLTSSISPAIKMEVALDRTQTIRASVHDVEQTLAASACCSSSSSSSSSCARCARRRSRASPCRSRSLGTFGVMYLLGYSLDNLSLMALTISTGFVVDDAIVVTENISALHRGGRDARRGGAQGRASRSASRSSRSPSRSSPCSSRSCSWAGSSGGSSASSRSRSSDRHRGLGARLAHADADDVLAAASSARGRRSTGGSIDLSERGFDAMLGVYERGARLGARATARSRCSSRWPRVGAHRRTCSSTSRRGSSRSRTPARLSGFTEAPQDVSFRAMRERQQAVNAVVQRRPRHRPRRLVHRRRRTASTGNTGTVFIELKPQAAAQGHRPTR